MDLFSLRKEQTFQENAYFFSSSMNTEIVTSFKAVKLG